MINGDWLYLVSCGVSQEQMSHEEVTAAAWCRSTWAAALPLLQPGCDPWKLCSPLLSAPHPCQKLDVSPSSPPGCSSTCSFTGGTAWHEGSGPEHRVQSGFLHETSCSSHFTVWKRHTEACKSSVLQSPSHGRKVSFGQLPFHSILVGYTGKFSDVNEALASCSALFVCSLSIGFVSSQRQRCSPKAAFSLLPLLMNFPGVLLNDICSIWTQGKQKSEWRSRFCTHSFPLPCTAVQPPLASSLSNKNTVQTLEANMFFLLVATSQPWYKGRLYLPLLTFFEYLNENLTSVSTEAEQTDTIWINFRELC